MGENSEPPETSPEAEPQTDKKVTCWDPEPRLRAFQAAHRYDWSVFIVYRRPDGKFNRTGLGWKRQGKWSVQGDEVIVQVDGEIIPLTAMFLVHVNAATEAAKKKYSVRGGPQYTPPPVPPSQPRSAAPPLASSPRLGRFPGSSGSGSRSMWILIGFLAIIFLISMRFCLRTPDAPSPRQPPTSTPVAAPDMATSPDMTSLPDLAAPTKKKPRQKR
jgi:hypothetical protein